MQPATLGRYRITGVLGRGGMGVVYEGHDPQIDRPVAIKTIALEALNAEEQAMFEGRFRAEMRSTGRLQHHNIAALYDTGRDGGTAYIVMERVTGHDLKRRLSSGERFSVAQAVDITVQLLAALEFAHRRHVIHRDVKPANLMLQADGVVKLCDFGVARLADADATRTQGMVVGSLRYASPEQITGQAIDARTDVFSTGVLLYELLTGSLPFKGNSDVEILHRIATDEAPSPRSLNADIPPEIDDAVRRALAKDPAARFASAAEFARALGASSITSLDTLPVLPTAAASGPAHAPTPTWPAAAAGVTTAPRSQLPLLAAAGAAAFVIGMLGWYAWRPDPPPSPPHPASTARAAAAPAAVAKTAALTAPAAAAPTRTVTPASGVTLQPSAPPSAAAPTAAAATTTPVAAPAPTPAASTPPKKPASAPAAASRPGPATPAPSLASVTWEGRLVCGGLLNAPRNAARIEPFEAKIKVEVAGNRISWTRESNTSFESASGTLQADGRFRAEGQGQYKDETRPAPWRVAAQGRFSAREQRVEAAVQLLRARYGTLSRNCTLRAGRG